MHARLFQLQTLLAERFPEAMQNAFSPAGQGSHAASVSLLEGKLVEIVASAGCGGEGLLLKRFVEESAGTLALVDGADAFDPAVLTAPQLQRLLWVRCRGAMPAIRSADLLLRDGNLSTVLMDFRLLPLREVQRLPSSVWHRLRMLAERSHVAVGIFSPCRTVSCAATRWVMGVTLGLEALQEPVSALALRLDPQVQGRQFHPASPAQTFAMAS